MLIVEFYLNELTGEAEPVIVDLTDLVCTESYPHLSFSCPGDDDCDLPF
jgi:hypothetical protein